MGAALRETCDADRDCHHVGYGIAALSYGHPCFRFCWHCPYPSDFIGCHLRALGLTGLAGGAAVAGCSAQMIGFAVQSYRENGVGGLLSQGLGTSMLQMPNIVRNPRIWIGPIFASAITGPLATCVFKLRMDGAAVSSGMGTCGLVGQIGVFTGWISDMAAGTKAAITSFDWLGLLFISFVLPAILSPIINQAAAAWVGSKTGNDKL